MRAARFAFHSCDARNVPGLGDAGHVAVGLHDVVPVAVDPLLEVEPTATALAAGHFHCTQSLTNTQMILQGARFVGPNGFFEPKKPQFFQHGKELETFFEREPHVTFLHQVHIRTDRFPKLINARDVFLSRHPLFFHSVPIRNLNAVWPSSL